MGVSEEDGCDDVWAISCNNLVEKVRGVGEWVAPIPAGEDVSKKPDTFVRIFGSLEL